jgi:hypothetical protein
VGRDLPGPPLARPQRRAGAIKSPHLLELSGIGNSGVLPCLARNDIRIDQPWIMDEHF